jgi:hypothetical protein
MVLQPRIPLFVAHIQYNVGRLYQYENISQKTHMNNFVIIIIIITIMKINRNPIKFKSQYLINMCDLLYLFKRPTCVVA